MTWIARQLRDLWNGGLDPETADGLELRRRRTTVGALLVLLPVGIGDAIVCAFVGDLVDVIGISIATTLAPVFLILQARLGWARLAAHGLTALLYFAVFFAMADADLSETSWAWAVGIPTLATLLRGWRAAAIWTPLTMITLALVCGQPLLAGLTTDAESAWHFLLEAELLVLCVNVPIIAASAMWARAQRAAHEATQEARAASEARAAFVATMSHELRTPMNGVLGAAQLLAHTALDAEQKRLLSVIDGSGEVLMGVINDVLDLARIDSGRMTTECIDVDLTALMDSVALPLRTRIGAREVELVVDIDPELPEVVVSDPTRLRQILFNLGGNAVKFTERGTVFLRARGQGERLILEVEDTGLGIAADVLPTLFERFTQADSTTVRRFGGTGLGLAIVVGLAEALGGRVHVRSEEGEGSCFTVELPLIASDRPATAPAAPPRELRTTRPLHVLVTDDNPVNRMVARGLLQRLGHTVAEAADGAEALARITDERGFDVVFLDVHMPIMGGLEAARRVRALPPPLCSTPLVALTADALPQHREEALAAGMNAHLAKPVRLEDLRAVLAGVQAAPEARRAAS